MSELNKKQGFYWNFFAWLGGILIFILALVFLFWLCFVNYVDNYEIGYRFDTFGDKKGQITMIEEKGYIVTWPFKTKVHTIDGRPLQVCISSINRVLNCKLVRFNKEGLSLFLDWHGLGSYAPTIHENTSSDTSLTSILKAYAYEESGKDYPFLTIIRELKSTELEDIRK